MSARLVHAIRAALGALALTIALSAGAAGQTPSSTRLASASDVAAMLGRSELVVLQVGTPAQFAAGHLPGARPVTLSDVSKPRIDGELFLELPDGAALERWARSVGISDASQIVVVAANDTLQSSTRVVFTLEVMGLGHRVHYLDGGINAWRAAGHPVEMGPATSIPVSTASLTVRVDSSRIATISDIDAAILDPSVAIIDARLPQFYQGNGGGYPRPGHIPTAVNIPLNLVSERGSLRSSAELRALFAAAGIAPGGRVVTYCHIGQQASLLWFVARELGYDARLYDGSFQQWSGSDRPVITR